MSTTRCADAGFQCQQPLGQLPESQSRLVETVSTDFYEFLLRMALSVKAHVHFALLGGIIVLLLALLLVAGPAEATVAFDSIGSGSGTGNLSWTHTPVGTPSVAYVYVICQGDTAAGTVDSVTYGGTAMANIAISPVTKSTGETFTVYTFVLSTGVPTGAQTVAATVTGVLNRRSYSTTLTAADDTEIVDSDTISSDALANPTVGLQLGGRTSFVMIGFMSGLAATADIAPNSGWTSRAEHVVGSNRTAALYTYDTIGSSDVTCGWTQIADDALAICVAVSEVQAAAGCPGLLLRVTC